MGECIDIITDQDLDKIYEITNDNDNDEIWRPVVNYEDTNEPLIWIDYDKYIVLTEEDIIYEISMRLKSTRHKIVKCITTGYTFNSITEAANYYNIDKSEICAVCNGRRKTTNNGLNLGQRLKWEYVN